MNTTKIYSWITGLAVIGILLAVYLLYSYYTRPLFQPCSINASINCDAIIKGEVSTTLGIPTAWYGFTGYVMILFAALTKKKNLLLGVATFGMLFCLRLMFIELVQLRVICPICVTCQGVMLGVFILTLQLRKLPVLASTEHIQK